MTEPTYGIPKGYAVDPPDESVGIFGEAWSHETCPDGGDVIEAADKPTGIRHDDGTEQFMKVLVCGTCLQEVQFFHDEYTGWNQPTTEEGWQGQPEEVDA